MNLFFPRLVHASDSVLDQSGTCWLSWPGIGLPGGPGPGLTAAGLQARHVLDPAFKPLGQRKLAQSFQWTSRTLSIQPRFPFLAVQGNWPEHPLSLGIQANTVGLFPRLSLVSACPGSGSRSRGLYWRHHRCPAEPGRLLSGRACSRPCQPSARRGCCTSLEPR